MLEHLYDDLERLVVLKQTNFVFVTSDYESACAASLAFARLIVERKVWQFISQGTKQRVSLVDGKIIYFVDFSRFQLLVRKLPIEKLYLDLQFKDLDLKAVESFFYTAYVQLGKERGGDLESRIVRKEQFYG